MSAAKHTPYFHPTVHRADPCGCSSEGDGTLRDPFHVKRCATHDSGPRLLRENAYLLAALEAVVKLLPGTWSGCARPGDWKGPGAERITDTLVECPCANHATLRSVAAAIAKARGAA